MKKLIEYIKKLTESDSNSSSKRFSALYTVVVLMTPTVFIYTSNDNLVMVLTILTAFVSTLFGISVHQDIKNKQNKLD